MIKQKMNKTEIIIHNSISLDGSLTGFIPEMELHYKIAGQYGPHAHLIGSETILAGIDLFGEGIPEEHKSDFKQPKRVDSLPWWVIVDSGGKLKGILHTCRRFEYCRDVIVLVSKSTPADYIAYLKERNYQYFVTGDNKCDLGKGIDLLHDKLRISKILTDTGMILGNLLINMGIVDELSLLIHPLIVGKKSYPAFSDIDNKLNLELIRSENFENGCVWNVYKVKYLHTDNLMSN